MSKRVFFNRECPTCGRRLLILVEYLGKKVVCPHCGAKIDAVDMTSSEVHSAEQSRSLMQRVDELLDGSSESEVNGSRLPYPR